MKRLKELYNREYSLISIYTVKTALMIFVLGMIIYYLAGKTGSVLAFISAVLKPLVLGLVFTYLLRPLVKRIETKLQGLIKKETPAKVIAVVLSFVIVFMVIGLIFGIIAVTVTKSLSSLNPAEMKKYLILLSDQFSKFWTTIEQQLASMNINLGSVGDMLGKIFGGVKSGASTVLFAMIFAIYFLLDEKLRIYWADVLDTFTSRKTREKLHQFVADADRVFSGYIRGQATDALIVGVLVSVALLIAGVPYAVVIGILTGIGNLVPYVGPVVGFGSLIVVCLAEGSVRHLIVGGIILAAMMLIDGNVINPKIVSNSVEVHPVLVIVALLAGGRIGGIVGMLVAVPVAALLKLQFDKSIAKRKQKLSGAGVEKDSPQSQKQDETDDKN